MMMQAIICCTILANSERKGAMHRAQYTGPRAKVFVRYDPNVKICKRDGVLLTFINSTQKIKMRRR